MLAEHPLALLPTPTQKEVDGSITLYRTKYGAELESGEAGRLLGGLMRWLYLTEICSPNEPEEAKAGAPSHSTQLTARKRGQSRKKA